MERLNAIPIVTAVFPCGEEEIAYTGVMTTALHNILRGQKRCDDDELVPVRLPQGDLMLFDVVGAIKRQVTAGAASPLARASAHSRGRSFVSRSDASGTSARSSAPPRHGVQGRPQQHCSEARSRGLRPHWTLAPVIVRELLGPAPRALLPSVELLQSHAPVLCNISVIDSL
jgi:hypothetical protein